MTKNELTGKRPAAIAGKILSRLKSGIGYIWAYDKSGRNYPICSAKELTTVAGSCLTQAPDKPKKKK